MKVNSASRPGQAPAADLPKAPTGIRGLDEITRGGLPRGRPTMVVGSSGSGKTVLSMEFLVRGATEFGEPGVFIAFQESAAELAANARSLGFDLDGLQRSGKLVIDHVQVNRGETEEIGRYDLEGLFIRLGEAIDRIKARRVVLDTMENLFAELDDHFVLRAELRRLFGWLNERVITTVATSEHTSEIEELTSGGFNKYVADCVLALEHRVIDEVTTRYMRVVKYRGSGHGTNEFPFLIGPRGVSILPITSVSLGNGAVNRYVSSGLAGLDGMLGGKGYQRGGSILIGGHAGTGKTIFAAAFADSICRHGGRCVYFAFEESAAQLIRNMRMIGIDLRQWVDKGLLIIRAMPATAVGLEEHLVAMRDLISACETAAVVIDSASSLTMISGPERVRRMLIRMLWLIKSLGITCLTTHLVSESHDGREAVVGLSSVLDTLVMLTGVDGEGERKRELHIVKARGIPHSDEIREFRLGRKGVQIFEASGDQAEMPAGLRRTADRDRVRGLANQPAVGHRQNAAARRQ